MNNNLQIFRNSEFGQVRIIVNDANDPIFCLTDLCVILSLNAGDVRKRLDDEVVSIHPIPDSIGRTQFTNFVNEEGFYDIVLGSRKENVRTFKKWVTSEVLPTIRKTGQYSIQKKIPNNFAEALKLAYEQQLKLDQQELLLAEAKPKVEYYDKILSSKDSLTVTQIAKDYGLSAQQLNIILNEEKVQYKQSGQWLPYKEYAQEGYTKSETINFTHKDGAEGTKLNTKCTQKGRLFIHELLNKKNIKPVMDR